MVKTAKEGKSRYAGKKKTLEAVLNGGFLGGKRLWKSASCPLQMINDRLVTVCESFLH